MKKFIQFLLISLLAFIVLSVVDPINAMAQGQSIFTVITASVYYVPGMYILGLAIYLSVQLHRKTLRAPHTIVEFKIWWKDNKRYVLILPVAVFLYFIFHPDITGADAFGLGLVPTFLLDYFRALIKNTDPTGSNKY